MHLILTESRALRFFSFTILYMAQGLPFGLVTVALPAYLAEIGTAPAAIGGFIGVAMLPWSFKLLAGPLMDRFAFLSMGRRRPWVLIAQLGLALSGLAFAFFPEGLSNLVTLTALCFVLNCFGATQDVAVDGMAIDVLPEEEHGRANAFMGFGQVAGISGAGIVSAFVLQTNGLPGIAVMLVAGFGIILLWAILVRERAGEKLLPWTPGQATQRSLDLHSGSWKQIVSDLLRVLFLPASLLLIGVSCLLGFGHNFWLTLAPIVVVQELGYASTEYSSWISGVSLIAGVGGLLLGSFIDQLGVRKFYAGALLAYAALAAGVGLSRSAWESQNFLLAVSFTQLVVYQGAFVSFIAIQMKLCGVKVAATQFAIYMTLVNLARSVGAWALGMLQPHLAYNQMFFVIGAGFVVAAILLTQVDLPTHRRRVRELER